MREGIGSISLYNIIIIFIAVTFALLAATMSYSKAFKVNSNIINALEIYEGYNDLSAKEIDRILLTLGYRKENNNCGDKYNILINRENNADFNFCLNLEREKTKNYNGRYFTYKVTSYMYFDLPIIGDVFKIPVTTKTSRIFCFDYNDACRGLVID